MCLFGIVERPGVSWDVLVCPGVIMTPLYIAFQTYVLMTCTRFVHNV